MARVGTAAPWPYDFRIAGTGFMGVRISDGRGGERLSFEIKGQPQIQQRLDTGDLAGVYGSPEAELPWVASDFSGGYGLRDQSEGVKNRYYYTSDVDARVPGKTMLGPLSTTNTLSGASGTVRALATMSDGGTETLFIAVGQYVYKSTDGSTWSVANDLGSGRVATSMSVFQGTQAKPTLYVGVEAGENYWTYINGTGWTEDANDEGTYFAVLQEEIWKSWKDSNIWKISKATDGGAAASWSGNYQVPDAAEQITEMARYDDRVYIFTESHVYTLQHAATAPVAEAYPADIETKNALNGVGSGVFNGRLYMCLPDAGLYEYTLTGSDQFVVSMGPGLLAANDSPVRGQITAVCGEKDYWLYAVIQNEAGNSFLLAWDRANNAWHGSLVDLGAVTCRKMIISGGITTNPQLFIGADENVVSIVLPRKGRDRSKDGNCTFAASGEMYLPRFNGNVHFIDKSYLSASARAEDLSANETIRLRYQSTPSGGYTALGSAWNTGTGGRKDFPVAGVKAEILDQRLDFARGSTATSSPKLWMYTLHYALRPTFLRQFQATALLGDDIPTNEPGVVDKSTYKELEAAINNGVEAGPVTLIAPNGVSYNVLIEHRPTQQITQYVKGESLRAEYVIIANEYSAVNTPGTWKRLEAYTYAQLEAYKFIQFEGSF